MPTPKFNFTPERQLNKELKSSGCWRVTIVDSTTSTTIYFPAEMVNALEMDGKYFRLFADVEKKAIGWIEVKGDTNLEDLKGARLAKKNKETGSLMFGVGRIIDALGYELKGSIRGLEVKTYTSPLVSGDILYVILPDVEKAYVEN